jgi:flotillin
MAELFEDQMRMMIAIICMVVVILLMMGVYASRYQRVPPNKVLLIYGRQSRSMETQVENGVVQTRLRLRPFRTIRGGGTFIVPIIERIAWLSLETHTIDVEVPELRTKPGIPIRIEAVAQVKIGSDEDSIVSAAEQILQKQDAEIVEMSRRILESHLRAICVNMAIEEINADRAGLSKRVGEAAYPDFKRLGLQLTIFVIKDIQDRVGYMEALGMKRTAEVKRVAQLQTEHAQKGEPGTQLVLSYKPVRIGDSVEVVGLSPGGMYIVRPVVDKTGEG